MVTTTNEMPRACRERLRKIYLARDRPARTVTGLGLQRMAEELTDESPAGYAHVFAPKEGSLYSSQTESKRAQKQQALLSNDWESESTQSSPLGYASLGKNKDVVNRELQTGDGVDLKILIFTPPEANLIEALPVDPNLTILKTKLEDYQQIPLSASRHLLENCDDYDLIAYIEDDIVIQDPEFFAKNQISGRADERQLCIHSTSLRTYSLEREM